MASTLMYSTVLHTAAAFNPKDYQSAWDQHLDMAKQMYTFTSGWIKQSHKVSIEYQRRTKNRSLQDALVHVAWSYKEKRFTQTQIMRTSECSEIPGSI